MSHPIVHTEIRSSDPAANRAFFGSSFRDMDASIADTSIADPLGHVVGLAQQLKGW